VSGRSKGYDSTDFLKDHTPEDLRQRIAATPEYQPDRELLSAGTPHLSAAERKLTFHTAREISTATSSGPSWRVEGFAANGAIAELVGKIKAAGKTTFAMHLCRAVLSGDPFMGFKTIQGPVVFMTEQSRSSFREALRRADLLDRDDFVVLFWHDTIGMSWPEVVGAAREEAKRIGAGMLIVDTLGQFANVRGDSENDAGAALEAMAPIQEAAAVDGLAVIVLRHERKSGGEVGDSGRGSSAYAGAVDIVLQLRRPEGQGRPGLRVLESLSRFDETPGKLVIELTADGYVALGDEEAVAEQEAIEKVIKSAPNNEDDAVTEKDLLAAAEVKRTIGQDAIRVHVAEGRLFRLGNGKRGDPYRYWCPQPSDHPSGENVSAGTPVVPAESNGHAPDGITATTDHPLFAFPEASGPWVDEEELVWTA